MSRTVMLAGAALLLAGTASAQDKATIDKLNERFAAAFNAGDGAAVAALYTDDGVILPPGIEMIRGRDRIAAFWTAAAGQLGDMKLTAMEVQPLGPDAAREIGAFAMRTKGAQPQDVAGKYVVVWHKAGGEWRLGTDIWNTNK